MVEKNLSPNTQPLTPNPQDLAPKTLLVTGGCGFIGSNFIRYVLREHPDWVVINLDKLTYAGNLANLADVEAKYGLSKLSNNLAPKTQPLRPNTQDLRPNTQDLRPNTQDLRPRYFFVRGSITDRKLVDSIFSGNYFASQNLIPKTQDLRPNIVVNFAAESHVDRSILDPSPFIETNIKGVQVLLEAIRKYGVERFIQISTDEVYGSLGKEGCFTEESPLKPNSPYAASKAAADLLCRAYHKAYGVPVIITRSSNNYGPYQFPEKLIPLMIRNALFGKELPVYGEGKQVRDWLYVEDNCRAIDLVLQKGKVGEIYNIGGGCEKKNIEVVQLICDILKNHPNTQHLTPKIQFIPDPRGAAHDFRYALDCTKIQTELGWMPNTDFEEGLRATVVWYIHNQEWVESVITGEYQTYYQRVYGRKTG